MSRTRREGGGGGMEGYGWRDEGRKQRGENGRNWTYWTDVGMQLSLRVGRREGWNEAGIRGGRRGKRGMNEERIKRGERRGGRFEDGEEKQE